MDTITRDDKLIWATPSGTVLTCTKSFVMRDGEVTFTEGLQYKVQSMHPLAEPAFVQMINDEGESHRMYGEQIRDFFKR